MDHENIYERQHSCKWYFDEAIGKYYELYVALVPGFQPKETKKHIEVKDPNLMKDLEDCLKEPNQFLNAVNAATKPEGQNREHFILSRSFFPLFLLDRKTNEKNELSNETDEKALKVKLSDIFEQKKFEICKYLNAVDSIVSRLCDNNVDHTSNDLDGHVVGKETILKWLFTGSGENDDSIQVVNRIKEFLRQIALWYGEQTHRDEAFITQINTLFKNANGDIDANLIKNAKRGIIKTISDAHDVYQCLNGFRKYAVRADLATEEMLDPECMNKVLALSKALLDALLSCCVSYMRIDRLQLPRADFSESRLLFANISESNFASASFNRATIVNGTAKDCDFSMASLREIDARKADFTHSIFSYSDLSGAIFENAVLSQCKINAANFGKKSTSSLYAIIDQIKSSDIAYKNDSLKRRCKEILELIEDVDELKIEDHQNMGIAAKTVAMVNAKSDELFNSYVMTNSMGALSKDPILTDSLKTLNTMGLAISVSSNIYGEIGAVIGSYNKKVLGDTSNKLSCYPTLPKIVQMRGLTADGSLIPDADFSLIDMSDSSWHGATLDNLRAAYTKSANANFSSANFYNSFLYKVDLNNASFRNALLGGSAFVGCDGRSVNFDGSTFIQSTFIGSQSNNYIGALSEAFAPYSAYPEFKISHAKDNVEEDSSSKGEGEGKLDKGLEKEDPSSPKIKEEIDIACDDFSDSSFKNVNGTKSMFAFLDLSRACFNNGLFRSAVFLDCNASSTTWNEADLTFSFHAGVIYNKGSMKGVSLQESNVYACDFTCVNLIRSKLLGSTFIQANFYDCNLRESNLSHSLYKYCLFRDSLLDGAILSSSKFVNCVFESIDFGECVGLKSVEFEKCKFVNCTYNKEPIEIKGESIGAPSLRICKGVTLSGDGQNGKYGDFTLVKE